jgi:hypothetical protein
MVPDEHLNVYDNMLVEDSGRARVRQYGSFCRKDIENSAGWSFAEL